MPSKYYQRDFERGCFYHIYNRGSNKSKVFLEDSDYQTFLEIIEYYFKFPKGMPLSYKNRASKDHIKVTNLDTNLKSSFSVVCFCLMPNHFHLLVRQDDKSSKNNSISNFMRRVMITYAMFFNDKYSHSGNLFQGRYKNVLVKSGDQLMYLSKYIHLNPSELLKKKALKSYSYSSYKDYVSEKVYDWLNTDEVLGLFGEMNPEKSYKKFVGDQDSDLTLVENIVLE